jgi:hypothetical protein
MIHYGNADAAQKRPAVLDRLDQTRGMVLLGYAARSRGREVHLRWG